MVVPCKAQTTNRNKSIPAPIGEPWVTCNDRFTALPFDDVLLSSTFYGRDFLTTFKFGFMNDFKNVFGG